MRRLVCSTFRKQCFKFRKTAMKRCFKLHLLRFFELQKKSNRFMDYVLKNNFVPLITNSQSHILLKSKNPAFLKAVKNHWHPVAASFSTTVHKPENTFSYRSHTCGELRAADEDKDVVLCGWLQFKRMNFFTLRDGYGVVQVIVDLDNVKTLLTDIHFESVLKIKGKVKLRPETQVNPKLPTGEVEVIATEIEVLGPCKANMPFQIRDFNKTKESTRLQFRYLNLRDFKLQSNLRLRSKFVLDIRNYLSNKHGFVDVETPTLFRRTPGGAQEFLVPTQLQGRYYSLTQSPQQFKQLLMVGAIDRYFQIARCYRDETTRRDRQPEFTQLDLEMSFVTADGIIALIENTLQNVWPDKLDIPFPKMTYQEAILQYGTDKPDLRHLSKIQNITSIINKSDCQFFKSNGEIYYTAIVFDKNEVTNEAKKELKEFLKSKFSEVRLHTIEINKDMSWKSSISKYVSTNIQQELNENLQAKHDQLIYLASSSTIEKSCQVLGKIRETICKFIEFPKSWKFLWITDFPLFEMSEKGNVESVHHPFTAPHPDDVNKIYESTKLTEIRGQHYDLVLNGDEVGGGSVRINNAEIQKYVLQNILKENVVELQYFLDALESGCPPHAGIALGLDRLISKLCGEKNIREVIAFPKSFDGKDPMSGAPATINAKDKQLYFL